MSIRNLLNCGGKAVVAYFNDTLRPHEVAREYVSSKFVTGTEVAKPDTLSKEINRAHALLNDAYANGKQVAKDKVYRSHKKGLVMAGKTPAQIEEGVERLARHAYDTYIDVICMGDVITETVLGSIYKDFQQGFMDEYLNYNPEETTYGE